jgi:predicted dehydrogenase
VRLAPQSYADFNEFRLIIREGDVLIPKIPFSEPLKNECAAFLEAIEKNLPPSSDGVLGLKVVQILEAAMESLRNGGTSVRPAPCASP